ncbi:hypothetical protein P8452_45201 [Trifolium repens]|nr:hypothetical protein P8452_45201 [Trifolium repens]
MASSSSSQQESGLSEEDYDLIHGSESGWVDARTSCNHLSSLYFELIFQQGTHVSLFLYHAFDYILNLLYI